MPSWLVWCYISQETPTSTNIAIQHVFFDNTVYIQTPLNKLPTGAAIFFEFKHWKADKKKVRLAIGLGPFPHTYVKKAMPARWHEVCAGD